MKKILVIEDEKKISRYLQLELQHEGYTVDISNDGADGLDKARRNPYSLIILDLMLPKCPGEEVCKKIREFSEVPIIILSAKDKTLSKVKLFEMGADDYLTKPFEIEELLARIKVAMRHKREFINHNQIAYENLRIDLDSRKMFRGESEVELTKTEFNLIHYLILNREIVLSREQILSNVWGHDYFGGEKIVDVYIKAIRKKIDTGDEKLIHTVRGIGYTLRKEK